MKKFGKMVVIAAMALGAVVSLAGVASAKEWKEVRIGTEGAFPPWNATKPDGTLYGFEIDLANDLCARMKVKCTFVQQSWDGIIPALEAGKFDAIMSGMSQTAKRAKVILFSKPYGSTGQAFGVEKSSDLTKMPLNGKLFNLDSDQKGAEKAIDEIKPALKGKIIGVQSGSIAAAFLQKYFSDGATIRLYKTTQQHDLDLASGRVDAVMASMAYLSTAEKKSGNEDMTTAGPRFQGGMLGQGSSIGMRMEDTDLKAMFDKAIAAAKADGTSKKISMKWFGFDVTVY
ncbi:MAG TPA: transporter substrate-binding domain-containing protein [Rhizobiaceae bacterium]|jgi:octopine/nopaline transport system substrate-binding protein|nr:transporter substrate-binding domain-containing protein [Rhizobiaceae bacterium]